MYVKNVGSCVSCVSAQKRLNRALLKPTTSNLNKLKGPYERAEAKKLVAACTAENALLAAALAQGAGMEEAALAGVEFQMALAIFKGVYGFDLKKSTLKSIGAAAKGHIAGLQVFRWASKCLTWIPGPGNVLNSAVAGTTTAVLGAYLIEQAEEMDKARKRGESLDNFIKKMNS